MPRGVPKINEKAPVAKAGRPVGSKTENTPVAIRKAFAGKTRQKMHALLDNGDKDAILTMAKLLFRNLPAPAIQLCKVEDSQDAVKALSQLIDYTAQGMIDGDQADRLERQITKYLEVTELAEIKNRLDAIESKKTDE